MTIPDELRAELAAVEREAHELRVKLQQAYQQLAQYWLSSGRCPCGAWKKITDEAIDIYPHVTGCPTAAAVKEKVDA